MKVSSTGYGPHADAALIRYQRHQVAAKPPSAASAAGGDAGPAVTVNLSRSVTEEDLYHNARDPRLSPEKRLKSAYRKLAQQYHPDKTRHMGESQYRMAESRFQELQEIYNRIKAYSTKSALSRFFSDLMTRIRTSDWMGRTGGFIKKQAESLHTLLLAPGRQPMALPTGKESTKQDTAGGRRPGKPVGGVIDLLV